MHYAGNLTITKENAWQYVELESVSGWLEVNADFAAPKLKSVGEGLYVNADFAAPKLKSVGEGLYVRAAFTAPELKSVGVGLYVKAAFNAPELKSVGGWLYVSADFTAPELESVDGEPTSSFTYVLNKQWPVLITDAYMRIGCQRHTKARWAEFSDAQIANMDDAALEFWQDNKAELLSMC